MRTSKGYVYKPLSHCPTHDLPSSQANILIHNDGRACLADFGLLTITSDPSTFITSCVEDGTIQWMSPELIYPESFGLKKIQPTKASDCYALGMVIHEILSGQTPFTRWKVPLVIQKVLEGGRPERPKGNVGALFTDDIWGILGDCWKHQPGERINAKAILRRLEETPLPQLPPSNSNADGILETDTDERLEVTASNSGMFFPFRRPSQVYLRLNLMVLV